MIFDKLENLSFYKSAHPRFADAISFIEKLIASAAQDGRHNMREDGANEIYANLSTYEPKPLSAQTVMEAHRQYIDIQIILDGEEVMYFPLKDGLKVTVPYNEAGDYSLMELPDEIDLLKLKLGAGYFVIFFAGEPHAPGVWAGKSSTSVRKLVGKVLA